MLPQYLTFSYLLFSALAAARVGDALQFDLLAGVRRCFYEQIAPDTRVRVGLVVISGSGQLPVSLRIARPALREVIYERDAADSEKFSFQTPPLANREVYNTHPPPVHSASRKIECHPPVGELGHNQYAAPFRNGTSALASTAHVINATSAMGRTVTGLGNEITAPERSVYSFCFESPSQRPLVGGFLKIARAAHIRPRAPLRRRLMFDLSVGNASKAPPMILTGLAKEQHVNDSEALFKAVRGRVLSLLASLDNMHAQAKSTDDMASSTSGLVSF
jgi:hypothetical protein